jgi:hypothetical protein
MLGADHFRLVELGLEIGDLEHLLGLLGQGNVADRERAAGAAHRVFDRLLQLEEIHPEIAENLDRDAFALAHDAEQQMFRADVVVAQPDRLFAAQSDHFLHSVGEIAFHVFYRWFSARLRVQHQRHPNRSRCREAVKIPPHPPRTR